MTDDLHLWRNARIAACDAAMTRFTPGALLTRGPRIEWVGAGAICPRTAGATTVEIKSGYGLTLQDEAKMLRVATSLAHTLPVTIAGTAMAIATDCNPGSAPGSSLLLAMSMATRLFGLTCEEALAAVTHPHRSVIKAGRLVS